MSQKRLTNLSVPALALGLGLIGSAAFADLPILVTSSSDSGEGSLRAALAAATAGGSILVVTEAAIEIDSTLTYEGTAPLAIHGLGQTVSTAENVTLLAAPNGADLTVTGLTFAGPGGWSIENRGDLDGPAGKGIFVGVPSDREGVVSLTLADVTVSGVANHGIHVSDCSLADACGSGSGGAGEGSPASISVSLNNVTVDGAGTGKFDADGLRVDERDAGSIVAFLRASTFRGVGADGVELDEGQEGDVIARVVGTTFADNGGYCDPAIMAAFVPQPDEAEFEKGTTQEDAIPGPVTGSPDDACVEREVDLYDDGSVEEYAFGLDLDDGIDIDEAGPGTLRGVMVSSTVTGNLDEGVDYDEEDAGHLISSIIGTVASGNTDDGIKHSEEGDGDVVGRVIATTAKDNGGKGIVYEEADDGDLAVVVVRTETANNDDGDDTGIEVVQEDAGEGVLVLRSVSIADGIDAEGVEVVNE